MYLIRIINFLQIKSNVNFLYYFILSIRTFSLNNVFYQSTTTLYSFQCLDYKPYAVDTYKYQINRVMFNVNNNNKKKIIYKLFHA